MLSLLLKHAGTGKPCGCIEKNLPHLPLGPHYTVQKKAWMDKTVMLDWIDLILGHYVAEAPTGIVPVLFLDSYRVHMMKSVVALVQALGVDVYHIPGGYTGLCQPVDDGFNKPLTLRMCSQWEE